MNLYWSLPWWWRKIFNHRLRHSHRKPLRQRGYQNNPTQLEHGYLHRTTRASHGAPRAPKGPKPYIADQPLLRTKDMWFIGKHRG